MQAAPPVKAGRPHICEVTETSPPEVNGAALTVAGDMPVGVVCIRKDLLRRFDPRHPMPIA